MDGAGAWSLYRAAAAIRAMLAGHAAASRKGAAVSTEASRESAGGAAAGIIYLFAVWYSRKLFSYAR